MDASFEKSTVGRVLAIMAANRRKFDTRPVQGQKTPSDHVDPLPTRVMNKDRGGKNLPSGIARQRAAAKS